MLRVWHSQSSVGIRLLWDLDLSGVQWETQGAGGTSLLCQVSFMCTAHCAMNCPRRSHCGWKARIVALKCFVWSLLTTVVILHSTPVILYRSVTMDKWKELELNKMKSGGNNKAKEFLEGQSDWKAGGNISANYNSKAAALYRDKVVIILLCLKVYRNVIYYAIRYLVRQKANPGVRRRLLLGITSLLISAPQAARLPARDRNKCQRRGE